MKVSETIVGQWYRINDFELNYYRCPKTSDGGYIFVLDKGKLCSTVRFLGEYEGDFIHLPHCTGYDYQPPAPEPVYRPFANAAEFAPFRDCWFKDNRDITRVGWYSDQYVNGIDYNYAFKQFTFDDGTPFGILESKDAAS